MHMLHETILASDQRTDQERDCNVAVFYLLRNAIRIGFLRPFSKAYVVTPRMPYRPV